MRIAFDTDSRRVLRYIGRVPPDGGGRPLDASVQYAPVAARYR